MKKILLAVFAFAAMSAYAQDVNDVDIQNELQLTEEAQEAVLEADSVAMEVVIPEETAAVPEEADAELPAADEEAALKKQQRCDALRTYMPGRKYINLSIASQKLKYSGGGTMKSKKSNSIEFGSTFFFNHRKPVVTPIGALRFGLDFSYLDITFATFELRDQSNKKLTPYFGNIGMQIGPSVTVTPIKRLNVRLYGHYAPSFVAYTPSKKFDEVSYGYAGYLTGGLQASYMFITLGVEFRSATANMATFKGLDFDFGGELEDQFGDMIGGGGLPDLGEGGSAVEPGDVIKIEKGDKVKAKLPGVRFIIGFRF